MINNIFKYKKFLGILSLAGIFMFEYTTSSILNSKYTDLQHSSNFEFKSSLPYLQNYSNAENKLFKPTKKSESLSNDDIINLIIANSPYEYSTHELENVDDEFGKTIYINVYLDLPNEVDDNLLIKKSIELSKMVNSKSNNKYTISYM